MRDILINQVAGFVVSLLTANVDKNTDTVVHLQGDHIAVALIDFTSQKYKAVHIINKKVVLAPKMPIYFDLASLTKPLTLAASYLHYPEKFSDEDILLLNHRAGLPPVFKVEDNSDAWKNYVSSLKISESRRVRYSDTSAIRLMLNLEKKSFDIPRMSKDWLDGEIIHWKDLPGNSFCPKTGMRFQQPIQCVVHDPIAFKTHEFVTNAGLFGTIDGVSKTLLKLNSQKINFLKILSKRLPNAKNEFLMGFEVNKFLESKPGGKVHGNYIIGHRGYTGTSFWINTKLKMGIVILTNTSSLENVRNHTAIVDSKNELRQKISDFVWRKYSTIPFSQRIFR